MPEGVLALDAETAVTIPGVELRAGTVRAAGYLDKHYAGTLPSRIRLLRDAPALYVDRPSASPGDDVEIHYSCSTGAHVSLRRWELETTGTPEVDLGFVQPATGSVPDEGLVADGLAWPGVTRRLPGGLRPGIWLVELTDDRGEVARAPLVVRRDAASARAALVILVSAATWQCYNDWGGRNRYRNYEAGVDRPSSPPRYRRLLSRALARAVPEVPRTRLKRRLGVDRSQTSWVSWPLTWRRPWGAGLELGSPLAEPALNHLASLDARILAWLDEHGIDYDCAAELDLDRDETLSVGRRAAVLTGHSEYWSARMFDRLARAHEQQGMWLINLSGNTMYRQIEVADDFTVRMCNLLTVLSGRDETELLGVRYSEGGYGTASPYAVRVPHHWVFAGLGLQDGDRFGAISTVANTSPGYAAVYHPERPTTATGLLHGSGAAGFEVDRRVRRQRKAFTVLAEAVAPHGAQMVVREPRGDRGGAFSVSSISFGGALRVDPACSRLVLNVLRRAGAEEAAG